MIKKSKSGLLQSLLNEEKLNTEELISLKDILISGGINVTSIDDILKMKEEIKNKSDILNEIIMEQHNKECTLIKELCIR